MSKDVLTKEMLEEVAESMLHPPHYVWDECPDCHGNGWVPPKGVFDAKGLREKRMCWTCNGSGKIPRKVENETRTSG